MINLTKQGAGNFILFLTYSAIWHNDLSIFEEEIGKNMLAVIGDYTGLTLNGLISFVNAKKNIDTDKMLSEEADFENMTIKELSEKYSLSESTVRNWANKNHKNYKKNLRTNEELAEQVIAYYNYSKGMCSMSELARHVGTNYVSVKKILAANNIRYSS